MNSMHSRSVYCTEIDGIIQEIQQQDALFTVIVHIGSSQGHIQECRGVVSQNCCLVYSGDYVKLQPTFCQVQVLILGVMVLTLVFT